MMNTIWYRWILLLANLAQDSLRLPTKLAHVVHRVTTLPGSYPPGSATAARDPEVSAGGSRN